MCRRWTQGKSRARPLSSSPGEDTVTADSIDKVAKNCEVVYLVDPAPTP